MTTTREAKIEIEAERLIKKNPNFKEVIVDRLLDEDWQTVEKSEDGIVVKMDAGEFAYGIELEIADVMQPFEELQLAEEQELKAEAEFMNYDALEAFHFQG